MNYGLSNDYQQFKGCLYEIALWLGIACLIGLGWCIFGG